MHRWLRHRRRGKRTPAVLLGLRWGHYGWCERNGEVMLLEAMVSEHILVRARSGDADAFRELVDPYRGELQFHCYRIATNRCLNSLRDRGRRPKELQPMTAPPEPTRLSEPIWLEPYPDILLEGVADTAPGPEARYETRESIGLAFAAALQHLPPRQRAALVLRDVLGFHTAEVADMLGSTEASVKGALRRARATLQARIPAGDRELAPLPDSPRERELVGRFVVVVDNAAT